MKIKIISYNILTGFYDDKRKGDKGKFIHNKGRQKAAQELIKEESPDILILPEGSWAKPNPLKIRQNYKKIFNYRYIAIGSDIFKNCDWSVTILSKYPIISSEDYTTKHSRFIRTKIKIGKKILTVDGVHPDPYHNEYQRAQWFKTVIRDRENRYILAGDFNAFSHQDNYNKKLLMKTFKIGGIETYKETTKDVLTSQTTKFLIKEGLIDTFKAKNKSFGFSFPTSIVKKYHVPSRLDYIFCSKDIKVLDSGIIKKQQTEWASDHYPVYAILEIK